MNIYKIMTMISLSVILVGCAGSSVSLNSDTKSSMKIISIDKNVALPKQATVLTRTASIGAGLGGGLGLLGAAVNGAVRGFGAGIGAGAQHTIETKIKISEVLKTAFKKSLQQKPFYYAKLSDTNADTTIVLSVKEYGIKPGSIMSDYFASGTFNIVMKNQNQKIIFQETCVVKSESDIPFEEFENHTIKSVQAFESLTKVASDCLIKKLP